MVSGYWTPLPKQRHFIVLSPHHPTLHLIDLSLPHAYLVGFAPGSLMTITYSCALEGLVWFDVVFDVYSEC